MDVLEKLNVKVIDNADIKSEHLRVMPSWQQTLSKSQICLMLIKIIQA